MGVHPLFKRFVGSEPGYEVRPQPKQQERGAAHLAVVQPQAHNASQVEDKYPVIRKGKIVGWGTF